MSSYAPEKIFSVDDNRECITKFFQYVDEEVRRLAMSNKTLLFRIEDDINWLVTLGSGAEYTLAKSAENISADCLVTADSYAMVKLARGILKPMSAIMGGQLRLEGDTNVFGEVSSTLKLAVKAMMEHNKQHFSLDVSITNTYEMCEKADGGDKYTMYIIRSVDRIGGNYWHTPHRYSDFVLFRKALEQQGYKRLPQLPRKHLRSSVDASIVRRRVEDLALFLQLVLIQVGSEDEVIIQFLNAYPQNGDSASSSAALWLDVPGLADSSAERGTEGGDVADVDVSDITAMQRKKHALLTAQHHAAASIKHQRPRSVHATANQQDKPPPPRPTSSAPSSDEGGSQHNYLAALRGAVALEAGTQRNSLEGLEKQRTTALREEVFQLRKRLEVAERTAGWSSAADGSWANFIYDEGAHLSARIAGTFLFLLPRVTLWGTIVVLVIGISLPMLLSSTEAIAGTLSTLLTRDAAPLASSAPAAVLLQLSVVVNGLVLPLFLWLVFFTFMTFLCSAAYTRAPAAFSLLLYIFVPIIVSAHTAISDALLHSVVGSKTCTLEMDITGERCNLSPLLVVMDCLLWLGMELMRTRGLSLMVTVWLLSTYVNYSLSQFIFLGQQLSSSSLLLSILSTLQSVERMFTIYTPTATVVSAYLHLIVLLGLFGCTKRVASDSSSAKDYLDSKNESRNLYSSAFEALDRVLAGYVLAEVRSLKSVFLRIAQYVAGRPDLVSALWADTLKCLHDNCPISSDLYVRQTVEACLSAATHKEDRANGKVRGKRIKRLEELFESFDMRPLQSGCVAQTHRATMRVDGRLIEVRVKVQHPAVEAVLLTDMAAALFVVGGAARIDPKWKVLPHIHTCPELD